MSEIYLGPFDIFPYDSNPELVDDIVRRVLKNSNLSIPRRRKDWIGKNDPTEGFVLINDRPIDRKFLHIPDTLHHNIWDAETDEDGYFIYPNDSATPNDRNRKKSDRNHRYKYILPSVKEKKEIRETIRTIRIVKDWFVQLDAAITPDCIVDIERDGKAASYVIMKINFVREKELICLHFPVDINDIKPFCKYLDALQLHNRTSKEKMRKYVTSLYTRLRNVLPTIYFCNQLRWREITPNYFEFFPITTRILPRSVKHSEILNYRGVSSIHSILEKHKIPIRFSYLCENLSGEPSEIFVRIFDLLDICNHSASIPLFATALFASIKFFFREYPIPSSSMTSSKRKGLLRKRLGFLVSSDRYSSTHYEEIAKVFCNSVLFNSANKEYELLPYKPKKAEYSKFFSDATFVIREPFSEDSLSDALLDHPIYVFTGMRKPIQSLISINITKIDDIVLDTIRENGELMQQILSLFVCAVKDYVNTSAQYNEKRRNSLYGYYSKCKERIKEICLPAKVLNYKAFESEFEEHVKALPALDYDVINHSFNQVAMDILSEAHKQSKRSGTTPDIMAAENLIKKYERIGRTKSHRFDDFDNVYFQCIKKLNDNEYVRGRKNTSMVKKYAFLLAALSVWRDRSVGIADNDLSSRFDSLLDEATNIFSNACLTNPILNTDELPVDLVFPFVDYLNLLLKQNAICSIERTTVVSTIKGWLETKNEKVNGKNGSEKRQYIYLRYSDYFEGFREYCRKLSIPCELSQSQFQNEILYNNDRKLVKPQHTPKQYNSHKKVYIHITVKKIINPKEDAVSCLKLIADALIPYGMDNSMLESICTTPMI